MQLVYFWIENHDILEEQEINFNSSFYFKMRKYGNSYILERRREREKKIPKNFFGEGIENISCIVGGNGSGKTTLLQSIITQKYYMTNNDCPKYLSVFESEGNFYIFKSIEIININFDYETIDRAVFSNNIGYIYFNNEILSPKINHIHNVFDISLGTMVSNIFIDKNVPEKNSVVYFSGEEILFKYENTVFESLSHLIFENYEVLEKLSYDKLKKKIKNIKDKGKIEVYFKRNIYINENERTFEELYKLIGEKLNNPKDILIQESWRYLCNKIVEDINRGKINDPKFTKREEQQDLTKWFLYNIEILRKIRDNYDKENIPGEPLASEVIIWMMGDEIFEGIIDLFERELYFNENNKILVDFYSGNYGLLKSMHNYGEIIGFRLIEKFSSGEITVLKLIERIFNLKNKIFIGNKEPKNIIFFMEELEGFIHPEWQRKLIEIMIKLKKIIPWMEKINVQYILTSHTPFMIGDIPGRNINYFQDEKLLRNEYETFGGNIYDILEESFLMKSYYGEFSIRKIENFIEILSKDENGEYNVERIEKNKDELLFIIENLGEELLKNNLEKMYLDYLEYRKKERDFKELIQIQKIKNDIKKLNLSKEEIFLLVKGGTND